MLIPYISAVLLSGGSGTRFGASVPKQYLTLQEKPVALHSFECFVASPLIDEIIVVCDASYKSLFNTEKNLFFARPGCRRQDSLFNGIQKISSKATHVLVHDAARPFITENMIERVIKAGIEFGAATVAMPVKATIKEVDNQQFVASTPDRSSLYEIQTPQIVRLDLLQQGFHMAYEKGLTATDDVFLAELLGNPVKLVAGCYSNIKITTIEDLEFAELITSRKRGFSMT